MLTVRKHFHYNIILNLNFDVIYFVHFYFRNGILVESYEKSRSVEDLVQYVKEMDDLKSAQPVATARFEELPSSVQHLNDNNFHEHLDKRSAVLVMFHIHGTFLSYFVKCFEYL